MSGVNKVIAIGNLSKDPAQVHGDWGTKCYFSVGINNKRKNKAGMLEDFVEWIPCQTFYPNLTDFIMKYVKKGTKVYIEGKFTTYTHEDKNTGKKGKYSYVMLDRLEILSQKKYENEEQTQNKAPLSEEQMTLDDDIPF